eukprot:SM000026S08853  [mRNA]  locus=s26:56369:56975:+ [translate_table: standard]
MDEAAWAFYMLFPKLVLGHLSSFGVSGRKPFQDRLAAFTSGEWEELAQQRAAAARVALSQRRARNGSVNQPSQQSRAGNLARTRRFGRAGELSRAAQALCPDPLATTNDATEAILRQLHPPPQHPLEPWAGELPSPLDLSAEVLSVALTKAPRMALLDGSLSTYRTFSLTGMRGGSPCSCPPAGTWPGLPFHHALPTP